jgi:hypothetical protein
MFKIYHYTTKVAVPLIQANGIKLGKSPFSEGDVVSMTANTCPKRVGLHNGVVLIEGVSPVFEQASKLYPSLVSELEDGTKIIKMFDQTEVRLEITIPAEAEKDILTYAELFKRDGPAMVLRTSNVPFKKLRKKQVKLVWAAPIHSADYPFGTDHIPDKQVDEEVKKIALGKKSHRALEWRFSTISIPPSYISKVDYRQNDGSYS